MRILHTSDLHLSVKANRTMDALRTVLEIAKQEKVDALTIGGDIFNSPADADALRPTVRSLFDDISFVTVGIPGNHDGNIFAKKFDFGFPVITKRPFDEVAVGDVTIVAVPYSDLQPEDLFPNLKLAAASSPQRILLLHCTLDIGFDASNYGDDGARRYFPVSRAALAGLGYDYVLGGHFHGNCQIVRLSERSSFVYPGSPVSITKGETGRRHAVLIDTGRREAKKILLPTFYYDSTVAEVVPGKEAETIEQAAAWCKDRIGDNCEAEVTVRGMTRRDEIDFKKELQKVIPATMKLNYEAKDVREVLEHPLYVRFRKAMKGAVEDSIADDVDCLVLEVMSSLIAGGEVE